MIIPSSIPTYFYKTEFDRLKEIEELKQVK